VEANESVAVVVFKGAKTEDCTYGAELVAQLDARFAVGTLQVLTALEAGLPAEHAAGKMGMDVYIFNISGVGHWSPCPDGLHIDAPSFIILKHSGPIMVVNVIEGVSLQGVASAIP
jgi:hypothetical protein